MKIGTQVRKVVAPIEGTVTDAQWNKSLNALEVLVSTPEGTQRWYKADELEVVAEPQEG
jgi:hypothetical protein